MKFFPACKGGDDRSLVITPDRGLFYCFTAREGGDCLALVQHVTGLELKDAAEFLAPHSRAPHGSPQPSKEQGKPARKGEPKKEAVFDAEAFAAKLVYSEEVEALGISEADAKELAIGGYRGRIYTAMRYPSGTIAGFQYAENIVLPKTLLPDASSTVVAFPKRA